MFRIRTALAAAVVAVAATLALAGPASAHDTIVSSTPAAGEVLTAAPTEVVVTFSNTLLSQDDTGGSAMTVVDESGKDWVGGAPAVVADSVTVPLEAGMPNGVYEVTWRVVSSDGHPTDGQFSFTVAADEVAPETTAPTEPEQTTAPEQTSEPEQPATPTPDAESAPWPLLIGLGVVLVAAVVVIIVIAARRKR